MIAFFSKRNPLNVLLLLLVAVVLKFPLFLIPQLPQAQPYDGPLYTELLAWLQVSGLGTPLFFSGLSFLFLFLQALLLNLLFNQQKMLSQATDLPGMSYLLLTSLYPTWSYWSLPLLVNLLFLGALLFLFRISGRADIKASVFNLGFAMGVASFLYYPSFILVGWLLIALAILRPFTSQEWLLTLLGLFTPIYFYGIWLFLTDRPPFQPFLIFTHWRIPDLSIWVFKEAGVLLLSLLPLLAGLYYIQQNTRKMLIQVRRSWSALFWLLLLSALLCLFQQVGSTAWLLFLVPLACYHGTFYFMTRFRMVPLLLFWLTILYVLAHQFSATGWKNLAN